MILKDKDTGDFVDRIVAGWLNGVRVEVLSAHTWAEAVAGELSERLADPRLRLCLATGATPIPV